MPKVKKPIRAAAIVGEGARHEPLGQVIQNEVDRNKYAASSRRQKQKHQRGGEGGGDNSLLDEKTSQRIAQLSREQQEEIEAEEQREEQKQEQRRRQQQKDKQQMMLDDSDDEVDEESVLFTEDQFVEHDDQGYVSIIDGTEGLSPEDEAIVASMMKGYNNANEEGEGQRTLADMIMEKIEEHEAIKRGEFDPNNQGDGGEEAQLPPKVVEVYTEIGKILSHYTAGKLPKAFKIIPSLSNWEDVLVLTRPDTWTPQAMYAATRIFASNLNPKMAQRFYNLILLATVRDDITTHKKLNYHYYMSLKKAVYKPSSFFKGIILPMCNDPNCTLREAAIVASVLQRVSIPVHHSAVAIHKLAQIQHYNGVASIFIKTLLNKKYSLPAPVIASLVEHFANFVQNDSDHLPVLWHQALLVFVQRYKNEIQGKEALDAMKAVMKKHYHPKITREVRRELFGAKAWKDERSVANATNMASMETDSMVY